MGRNALNDLYDVEPIAQRIVDLIPEESLREFITFETEADLNLELMTFFDDINFLESLFEAWRCARLYGVGYLFINVNDNKALDMPLSLTSQYTINDFKTFHRYDLQADQGSIVTDISSHRFRKPLFYDSISPYQKIHHSRIIQIDGAPVSPDRYIHNGYCGGSVLERVDESLKKYSGANANLASILHDFRLFTVHLSDLARSIDEGKLSAVQSRIHQITESRNTSGCLILDSQDQANYLGGGLDGVSEVYEKIKDRLQAATEIPHNLLFNQSPSDSLGGNTGSGERNAWYDTIKKHQKRTLKPVLDKAINVILTAQNGPKVPTDLKYNFNSLYTQTEKEKLDCRKVQAEIDSSYENIQVLSSEEIRNSRFKGEFSYETSLEEEFNEERTPEISEAH